MKNFKENKNAPEVRFIRVKGRVIPIVGGKKSPIAARVLKKNMDELTVQVEVAEAGRRFTTKDGEWTGHKSTFPDFFRKNGFRTKEQWMKAMQRGEGKDFEVIRDIAADKPNFKIATKQIYDNNLVVFRNIGGRVIPMRVKSQEHYDFWNYKEKKHSEEVPF